MNKNKPYAVIVQGLIYILLQKGGENTMYTVLIQDDNSVIATVRQRIMQNSIT